MGSEAGGMSTRSIKLPQTIDVALRNIRDAKVKKSLFILNVENQPSIKRKGLITFLRIRR